MTRTRRQRDADIAHAEAGDLDPTAFLAALSGAPAHLHRHDVTLTRGVPYGRPSQHPLAATEYVHVRVWLVAPEQVFVRCELVYRLVKRAAPYGQQLWNLVEYLRWTIHRTEKAAVKGTAAVLTSEFGPLMVSSVWPAEAASALSDMAPRWDLHPVEKAFTRMIDASQNSKLQ